MNTHTKLILTQQKIDFDRDDRNHDEMAIVYYSMKKKSSNSKVHVDTLN